MTTVNARRISRFEPRVESNRWKHSVIFVIGHVQCKQEDVIRTGLTEETPKSVSICSDICCVCIKSVLCACIQASGIIRQHREFVHQYQKSERKKERAEEAED